MESQQEYVRKVFDAYRNTPGTSGVVRRPDRLLATQLYERGVPLIAVVPPILFPAVVTSNEHYRVTSAKRRRIPYARFRVPLARR
jgi:hypothetical protein